MTIPYYNVGTVSIPLNGTIATFAGGALLESNAKADDTLIVDGFYPIDIVDIISDTQATIDKWPGVAVVAGAYKIRQNGLNRYSDADIAEDVLRIVDDLDSLGYIIFVSAVETTPNPRKGDEGQLAFQRTTGRWWEKLSGVWTLFTPAGTLVTARSLGIFGDGVTVNDAAIAAAITYCITNGKTLVLEDGTYLHHDEINWAFDGLHVMALGEAIKFLHTGTGIAHNFRGIDNYPGTQGCVRGVFGGPGRIRLCGNNSGDGGTTVELDLDNWQFGYMKIELRDAATLFRGDDTGIVGASSVGSVFDILIRANGEPFITAPTNGIDFSKHFSCQFPNLVVEGCGPGGVAVAFKGASKYTVQDAIVESNLGDGIHEDSACTDGSWNTVDSESNSGADWTVAGRSSRFIHCQGLNNIFNSTGATVEGGVWNNTIINDNTFWSKDAVFLGTFTNNGTHPNIINPIGGIATAISNLQNLTVRGTFTPDDSSIAFSKLADLPSANILGNSRGVTGSPQALALGAGFSLAGTTLNLSVSTATIQNNAVTFAKMQTIGSAKLLGNPTGGTAAIQEITLGANLVLAGTTLSVGGLVKGDVGLGNVDNTSDVNKPISTATQTALDLKASIAYANSLVVGLVDDRGNYNASGNTFPASGGSGAAGAILKGDIWVISVAGTLGGVDVNIGDQVRALTDTPGQTAGNWAVSEGNIGYTPVRGPSSVTDDLPVVWDGTSGTLTKQKTYAAFKALLALVKSDVGLGSVDNTADSAKSVASAAALTTARNINGISFNGSADIEVIAAATHVATSKATPVDADELALVDSAAANVLKKLTWANLKATLRTYFAGQLPGTTTNDDASAGNVGEYLFAGGGSSLGPVTSTVTITIANPAVVTMNSHGFSNTGTSPVVFSTTGALPNGGVNNINAGTTYWTVPGTVTTNTFQIASSIANAVAGTTINTSGGTQSGTQTGTEIITLTTDTSADFGAIKLTAGDWDVGGSVGFVPAGTTSVVFWAGWTSTASVTVDQQPGHFYGQNFSGTGSVLGSTLRAQFALPTRRVTVANAATQIIYGVQQAEFSVSTTGGFGAVWARRVR